MKIWLKISPRLQGTIAVVVGAYTGKESRALAQMGARVIAVEADPSNFALLVENIGSLSIHAVNKLVSNHDGTESLFVANHPTAEGTAQSNSIYRANLENKQWAHDIKEIPCIAVTMNTLLKGISSIGLVRINCEGGEYKLFNADTAWLAKVDMLYLDWHAKCPLWRQAQYQKQRRKIIDTIKNAGFKMKCGDKDAVHIQKSASQLWVKA